MREKHIDESIILDTEGFQWDKGNEFKNWNKHKVTRLEAEQVFLNRPILLLDDIKHSQNDKRHFALGQTDEERKLFISFTIRGNLIRVISARPMHKKEEKIYEQEETYTSI